METTICLFGGPPATVNDVIEWLKRLVTISGITGAPKQCKKLQLNYTFMSIFVVLSSDLGVKCSASKQVAPCVKKKHSFFLTFTRVLEEETLSWVGVPVLV